MCTPLQQCITVQLQSIWMTGTRRCPLPLARVSLLVWCLTTCSQKSSCLSAMHVNEQLPGRACVTPGIGQGQTVKHQSVEARVPAPPAASRPCLRACLCCTSPVASNPPAQAEPVRRDSGATCFSRVTLQGAQWAKKTGYAFPKKKGSVPFQYTMHSQQRKQPKG